MIHVFNAITIKEPYKRVNIYHLFSYRLGIFINTTTNVTQISIKYKRHIKNSAIQSPLSKESINQDKDYLKVSEKSKNTTENVK